MTVFFDDDGNLIESNLLVKIQKIEYLKQIQQGQIYMKNLRYFNKLKQDGIGDDKEGFLADFTGGELIFDGVVIAEVKVASVSLHTYSPVFCLFNPKFECVGAGQYRCIIPKKTIDELAWDTNCEYGALIIQKPLFDKRMIEKLEELNIGYAYGHVNYTDDFDVPPKEESYKVAFRKRKRFEDQSEYRWLLNIDVDDNYTLDIGDISEFSTIIPINEHKDFLLEVRFDA